jgi:uncharacterized protein (AIM24 family)
MYNEVIIMRGNNNEVIIMRGSYIAHFTNVSMRFTTSGGLFRAALAAEQLTIMRN